MSKRRVFAFVGVAVIAALGFAAYKLGGAIIPGKIEQRVVQIGLSPNQVAANGPLPGEVSLYPTEWACSQALDTPGYFRSLNGAEISDAQRSGVFPCASFTGSRTGPNRV